MKKVLLILHGEIAKYFLDKVINSFYGNNKYIVVTNDFNISQNKFPTHFLLYNFDPTSYSKIFSIMSDDIIEAFIIMDIKSEILASLENIRKINPKLKVCILDTFDLNISDKNLVKLNVRKILVNNLVQKLPNVPIVAQNIGLSNGEIMEVAIPAGSSYAHRFISSIEQKDWRIVGLYRDGLFFLVESNMVILPNDNLLIVGEPSVLNNVYRAAKEELGTFPAPFGNNIYLYLDMLILDIETIKKNLKESLYLNQNLKNTKLVIRVVNPTNIDFSESLKKLESKIINIHIAFTNIDFFELLTSDSRSFGIGLIIISNILFGKKEYRKALYERGLPVIKLSQKELELSGETVLFLSDKKEIEKISSILFDISMQLGLNIFLYDFDKEAINTIELIEHYENLAKIYSKHIQIIRNSEENPIVAIKKKEHFLQVLPFTKDVAKGKYFWFFSVDIERLYFRLDKYNQLFLPVAF